MQTSRPTIEDLGEISEIPEQNQIANVIPSHNNTALMASNMTKKVQFNFEKGSGINELARSRRTSQMYNRKVANRPIGDGKKYCITDTNHNDLR